MPEPGSWGAPERPPSVSWWGAQGLGAKIVIVLVSLVLAGAVVAWIATSDFDQKDDSGGETPISEMKCWQLAEKWDEFIERSGRREDIHDETVEFEDRLAELNECPGEPTLQGILQP